MKSELTTLEQVEDKCNCGNKAAQQHACPYQQDVNDCFFSCTCCAECTQECANSI